MVGSMAARSRKKQKQPDLLSWQGLKQRAVSLGGAALMTYVCFLLVGGDRGLLSYYAMQQDRDEALTALELVTADRMRIEHRVRRMRDESLDTDLLEEQAKGVLGYVRPDERLIIID